MSCHGLLGSPWQGFLSSLSLRRDWVWLTTQSAVLSCPQITLNLCSPSQQFLTLSSTLFEHPISVYVLRRIGTPEHYTVVWLSVVQMTQNSPCWNERSQSYSGIRNIIIGPHPLSFDGCLGCNSNPRTPDARMYLSLLTIKKYLNLKSARNQFGIQLCIYCDQCSKIAHGTCEM